jgi:hypothetical protein
MASETPGEPTDVSNMNSEPTDTPRGDQGEPSIPSAVSSGLVSHIPMFFDYCEEEPVLPGRIAGIEGDTPSQE